MNDNRKLLSIVIPCFNAEKYIKKCLNNVLKIELNKEIIVINDGSSDNSLNLLKEYADLIILINLEKNKGVSHARNLGIKKATGRFITFIDIDDEFDLDMHIKLLDALTKNNCDISMSNYDVIETNGKVNKSKYNLCFGVLDYNKAIKFFLTDKIIPSACMCVFKTDLVKANTFNENLDIGEDILFILNLLLCKSKIVFVNEPLYHYVQNTSSAIHMVSEKSLGYLQVSNSLEPLKNNYLSSVFFEEYQYFKLVMFQRTIHILSASYKNNNKSLVLSLLKKCYKKDLCKAVAKNKYSTLYLKIEFGILSLFGIKFHLFLFPIYNFIKSILR